MAIYGGFDPWLSVPIGALLWAYLGVFTGLAMLADRPRHPAVWRRRRLVTRPVTWVAMEWTRSRLFGGFPWALLGTSQARVVPIVQVASVAGVFGLSLLLVLVSSADRRGRAQPARPRHLADGPHRPPRCSSS